MPCQIRSMRLFSAVQCHSWLCRCDGSFSGMKDKGILSRGSGCQMPSFLSDLTPLAWPQPHVKCSGRQYVEGRREKSFVVKSTFCSACACLGFQISAFPKTALFQTLLPSPLILHFILSTVMWQWHQQQ